MRGQRTLSPEILRAYDIRGRVEVDLGADDLFAIGRAFAKEMHEADATTAAVGFDGRLSSLSLAAALIEGLTSSGIMVTNVGCGPSPMLYFATHHLEADAGLMITGSHNPPDYNGLKMTLRGRAFFGDDILRLGKLAEEGDFVDGVGGCEDLSIFDTYVERLASEYRGEKELKIAWDPGNGASGDVISALTKKLPGSHVLINEVIDGTFPAHHPDPTVEANLAQLKDAVAANGCDLGIGFDGDGDRVGIIDSQGRVLWGDQLLTVLAREVLDDMPGAPILCDVKASRVFFDEIRRLGGEPVMWKAGHSHIKSKMQELGAPLAGEMSAHIFFKHRYYGYDDAPYAAVRLLSVLASGNQSVADIIDALPVMHNTPEVRFDCPDDRKFAIVDEIVERVKARPGVEYFDMDGIRVELPDGWWLLRASNTQAMLVVRCESATPDGLESLKADVCRELEASGVSAPAF